LEEVVATLHPLDRESGREIEMIHVRLGCIGMLCGVMGTSLVARDFSSYRGIHFGANVAVVVKQAGMSLADARVVHQRPALIQEVDWQPRWQPRSNDDSTKADPVQDGLLCFYNGDLFRIVVTYDRYKVAGMTAEDMIEGISATYGAATRPTAEIAYHSFYGEVAPVIARWEDSEYSYNLVQTGDQSGFAMILYSKRLDALAQAAIVEAVRLEAQEAPQRELDKEKKRQEEEQLVLEKARSVNKPNFRP
jgi:hypothetical protein